MKIVVLTKPADRLPPQVHYLIRKIAEVGLVDHIVATESNNCKTKNSEHFSRRLNRLREKGIITALKDRRDAILWKRLGAASYYRRCNEFFEGEKINEFPPNITILEAEGINSLGTQEMLEALSPDILVQCGAGILKKNIFMIPKIGTLNVHCGIAPEIRGMSSIFWGLYYGRYDWIGVTIHFIDEGLDTGPVLKQKRLDVKKGDDFEKLFIDAVKIGGELLIEVIKEIKKGEYFSVDRRHVKSVYTSRFTLAQYKHLRRIRWRPVEPHKYE